MKITVGVGTAVDTVSLGDAKALATALDIQVKRDLKPIWDVDAEVIFVEDLQKLPAGVHPIIITAPVEGDFAGKHFSQGAMTHAFINANRNWRLAASHECLEMLVDPTGVKFITSPGIQIMDNDLHDTADDFHYLLEVCDPVENPIYAYEINGIPVSDFYTPEYFDRQSKPGARYSHRGSITRPRQILPDGYISWYVPETKIFHQIKNFDRFSHAEVGSWSDASAMTARMFIDANTRTPRSA